jgi:GT2 family glycosyltransferase
MRQSAVWIVVLNWNNRDDTLACLESLAKAELAGATVLVVDNGSRDGSAEAVRERFPEFRLLALPENRGFAGGNNAGIRAALDAGAEGVLLLNNDTIVDPTFLFPLVQVFHDNPDAAAASSAIHRLDHPDMLDVAYSTVDFRRREAVRILGVNAVPGLGHGFNVCSEVEVTIGCSMLMSAKALGDVGLFDEAYFAYHEDVDWSLRARKRGYRLFYQPWSRVFHRGSRSTRSLVAAPRDDAPPAEDALPEAEPMPWNPVRSYLGARNLIRLLKTHATREEKSDFVRSCLWEIPLELLAVIKRKEGWLRLGRWGYKTFLREHFVEPHPSVRSRVDAGSWGAAAPLLLVFVPIDLMWNLPREIWEAHRQGRLAELRFYLRGLWDGLRDRPLPLAKMGLK